MPVQLTYPGVYIEEIPSGVRTITGVATSITAFVGFTVRGPVNEAAHIFNFGDFERTFGGLDQSSEISYAVQQFFLNGGTEAYVVRVAKGTQVAQVTLKDMAGNSVLVVSAASPGVWGNNVRLDVDYATSNPDSTFNLTATRYELQNGTPVAVESEKYRNLSMNKYSSTYALNVVSVSKLISLKLPAASLTFSDSGYSKSGQLETIPALNDQSRNLSILLDGKDQVTLTLTGPLPTDMDSLVASLNAAATAVGIDSRLIASTPTTGTGAKKYLILTSQNPPDPQRSSVEVQTSPPNSALPKLLKLGLVNGGREKDAASYRRPAPTGTFSADLSDTIDTNVSVGGAFHVVVNDNSTGSAVPMVTADFTLPSTQAGTQLRDALKKSIQSIADPSSPLNIPDSATRQATVQLEGTFLHIVPSADMPNASIIFSGVGASAALLTGTGSYNNVQQYSLGVGANFGSQVGATAGIDGVEPDAAIVLGDYDQKTGMYALRDVDLFNLLVIPRTTRMNNDEALMVIQSAITFCEERRAFYLIDPDPTKTALEDITDWSTKVSTSKNAAIYFSRIMAPDPLDKFRIHDMPASGAIAGVFARTDTQRGVWKAPAGIDAVISGVQGLSINLTDPENGALNQHAVNCLRTFPVYGTIVWGARTRRGDDAMADEYKYIPVRRMALYIEESLYRGLKWAVFEPNDEPLWAQIRLNVGAFMHNLFVQGAFQGTTPKAAYFVKCDSETTTQNDIDLGIVNVVVGFAPLKPAEFVVIKIQQIAGELQT